MEYHDARDLYRVVELRTHMESECTEGTQCPSGFDRSEMCSRCPYGSPMQLCVECHSKDVVDWCSKCIEKWAMFDPGSIPETPLTLFYLIEESSDLDWYDAVQRGYTHWVEGSPGGRMDHGLYSLWDWVGADVKGECVFIRENFAALGTPESFELAAIADRLLMALPYPKQSKVNSFRSTRPHLHPDWRGIVDRFKRDFSDSRVDFQRLLSAYRTRRYFDAGLQEQAEKQWDRMGINVGKDEQKTKCKSVIKRRGKMGVARLDAAMFFEEGDENAARLYNNKLAKNRKFLSPKIIGKCAAEGRRPLHEVSDLVRSFEKFLSLQPSEAQKLTDYLETKRRPVAEK